MYVADVELLERLGIPPLSVVGRTALITGGARGIGEATAVTLAHLGARIVIVDILASGQDVADSIKQQGGQAEFIQCDLSDVDQLLAMIPQAESSFGAVDILLNNALHLHSAPIADFSLEEWDKTFDTNARAPFLLIKHFLPLMLERKHGVIVNMIAYEGSPMAAAYSGTKMALRSLAYTAAREIGNDSGVSVFSFIPGIVDTPLVRDVILPNAAAVFGITEEEVIPIIAQNPGYDGFIPVEHCVSALVHAIVRAREYHAQVADPFEPLDRAGRGDQPAGPGDEHRSPDGAGALFKPGPPGPEPERHHRYRRPGRAHKTEQARFNQRRPLTVGIVRGGERQRVVAAITGAGIERELSRPIAVVYE